MSLVFIFTDSLELTGIVGFFDVVIKLFLYYLQRTNVAHHNVGKKKNNSTVGVHRISVVELA